MAHRVGNAAQCRLSFARRRCPEPPVWFRGTPRRRRWKQRQGKAHPTPGVPVRHRRPIQRAGATRRCAKGSREGRGECASDARRCQPAAATGGSAITRFRLRNGRGGATVRRRCRGIESHIDRIMKAAAPRNPSHLCLPRVVQVQGVKRRMIYFSSYCISIDYQQLHTFLDNSSPIREPRTTSHLKNGWNRRRGAFWKPLMSQGFHPLLGKSRQFAPIPASWTIQG